MVAFKNAMLKWLAGLAGNHVISSQYIMGGSAAALTSPNAIFTLTGQQVGGLVGNYFDDSGSDDFLSVSPTNTLMIEWWNAGGLCFMCCGTPNPSAIAGTVSGNTGQGNVNVNAAAILTPGTPDNLAWIGVMTEIAAAFMILQLAGVMIIWRPLHEMNGNWNWWATVGFSPSQFAQLWRMWRAFNDAYGLQNLIYVYASNGGDLVRYPGDAYVDIVGFDAYLNTPNPSDTGYNTFLTANPSVGYAATKPIAYTEFGPGGPAAGNTSFDMTILTNELSGPMNKVIYWTSWGDGNAGGAGWSIDETSNASAAMNNPYVWNRGNTAAPRPVMS